MGISLNWYLPTNGDSRTNLSLGNAVGAPENRIGKPGTDRAPDLAYLGQIARGAEAVGFNAVLTPTGSACEDAWISTAALIGVTERLSFLVAFRPGLQSPTLAAQMAATYQRMSGGRLLLNVVTGGDDAEQRRFGDHLAKEERYARCAEFLHIVRELWKGDPVDFDGEHYSIRDATVIPAPVQPQLFFGGSSAPALSVAAAYADVYLTWGEPPDAVADKLSRVRDLAEGRGRELRFGIRLHVITRDTAEEAWAETDRLLSQITPEQLERAQAAQAASQSEGQRRMRALHGGRLDRDALVVSPNLWAGVGLVRGGAGTALVGSHEEVVDRIAEYHALGIDEFILSGYPHLEEVYRAGEGLMPELARRGLLPQGEAVAAGRPAIQVAAA